MSYRLGTDVRIKDRGETLELECPNCKSKVKFGLFTNMENRFEALYPFLNSKTVYFLVCPKCASVYTVDEAKGDEFRKGEKLSIGNFDLKPLKVFNNEND